MNATMPSEALARHKFSCAACGGEAEWNPSRGALVCPYCGTTSTATLETAADGSLEIRENELAQALREVPDESRGWQTDKTEVRCQSCQAISVFDPARVGQRCDFCGSSALVPYEQTKQAFRPESLLPMKLSEPAVREAVRSWYGSHFWAPRALGRRALTDRVHGLYVPYWTFDAHADAEWTAQSGDYYYVTETYRTSEGKTASRQVRKVRWYPTHGSLSHFFDDELVPATRGLDPKLLGQVEPFPTAELVPYDPSFLSGWVVERYQLDLGSAASRSREQMQRQLESMCAARVPGDTHRDLQVHARYSGQTFKHILVPLWLLTYRYGSKDYRVIVNGFTGSIAGTYPISAWKVAMAVVLGLLALGVAIYLFSQGR